MANKIKIAGTTSNTFSVGLNGDGNITAAYYIGNGSQLTGVVASATPGGANTQLQYNNNGTTGGISNVTWNGSNLSLGPIANIKISGGSNNYIVVTDGTGNLNFATKADNLTVGTRSTYVNIPIPNYTMNVLSRTGNITVNVN